MLILEDGDTIDEIALQLGVPMPREEAILPAEAAAILGDEPVDSDPTYNVRRRIRDGRFGADLLLSFGCRSAVSFRV